jgi:hypothetical protein
MSTLGVILFFVFLAAVVTCVIASASFKAEARAIIEKEGGALPLSMRTNLPIDVRQLRGAAVVPATKSNKWDLLACAIGIIYFSAVLIVLAPPPAFLLMFALPMLCSIGAAIYVYRISRPQEHDELR